MFKTTFSTTLLGTLVALLLLTAAASAQEVDQPDSSQRAPIPRAFGQSGSVKISPGVGSVTDSLALSLPRSRRGFEPKLSFDYNSGAGAGDLGRGWSLGGFGHVEYFDGDGVIMNESAAQGSPTVERFAYRYRGGGGELVQVGTPIENRYRAVTEDTYYDFRKFEIVPDTTLYRFEMRTGDGVIRSFGRDFQTQIGIRRWLLDEERDASGNTITYEYACLNRLGQPQAGDGNIPNPCGHYPTAVRYASHALLPAAHKVEFEYETRPDVRETIRFNTYEQRALRLSRVSIFTAFGCADVEVCPSLVRRYELSYTQSPLSGESMLAQIVLVGADDFSRVTLRTLEYGQRSPGWQPFDFPADFPEALYLVRDDSRDRGTRFADVNGDGFADAFARPWPDDLSLADVYLGSEAGFSTSPDPAWSASFKTMNVDLSVKSGERYGADTDVRIQDVNGDRRPDVVILPRREVWLNTGTAGATLSGGSPPQVVCSPCGWQYSALWSDALANLPSEGFAINTPGGGGPATFTGLLAPAANQDNGLRFADVNADGRLDIIQSLLWDNVGGGGQLDARNVFLNTGSGWERSTALSQTLPLFAIAPNNPESFGWDLLEVNGDGLVDLVNTAERSQRDPSVWLGSPGGWIFDQVRSEQLKNENDLLLIESQRNRRGTGLMPLDYNGDGLIDFVRNCSVGFGGTQGCLINQDLKLIWRNTGTTWVRDFSLEAQNVVPPIILDRTSVGGEPDELWGTRAQDFDADGVPDWLLSRPNLGLGFIGGVSLAPSVPEADLLVRSTSTLGEVTEIAWEFSSRFDNTSGGVEQLPMILRVATELTRHDGLGNVYTSTVDYEGGGFFDGEYRGFARTFEDVPGGLRRETLHSQASELVGRSLVQSSFDSQDRLRARRTTTWALRDDEGGLVAQVLLEGNDEEIFDEQGSVTLRTRTVSEYDDRLNLVRTDRDPDLDSVGRETVNLQTWVRDDAAGIWSVPEQTRRETAAGDLVAHTRFVYDDLAPGQVARGLPTTREDWVEGSGRRGEGTRYVSQNLQYDAFGNIVAVVDRNGKTSTFVYADPAATYRTSGVDAEGRASTTEYDPRFGSVTRDVPANGLEQINGYDAFGRLAASYLPGDPIGVLPGALDLPSRRYYYGGVGGLVQSCPATNLPGELSWCVPFQHFTVERIKNVGEDGYLSQVHAFDARGLIHEVQVQAPPTMGPTVNLRRWAFDEAGNVVAETGPFFASDPPPWRYTDRDELRRPIRIEDPDGRETTFAYEGNRVRVTDRRGFESSFERDNDGNLIEVNRPVDGVDQITRYEYDVSNQPVRIVDAMGSETRVFYDGLGRRTRLEDTNLGAFDYVYDDQGNLLEQTAPDGATTTFTYNDVGDLLRKSFPNGSAHVFEYGAPGGDPYAVGRLTRVVDAAGSLTLVYDARGNLIERRRDLSTRRRPGKTYVTGFAFDGVGRPARVTYPDGYAIDYGYDEFDPMFGGATELVSVTDDSGRRLAHTIDRNAAGQLLGITYGNAVRSSFSYNATNRPMSIVSQRGAAPALQNLAFAYDDGHNITGLQDFAAGESQLFAYDDVGRLVNAVGGYGNEDFVYDPTGGLLRNGPLAFAADPARPQRITCAVDANVDPTAANCAQHAAAGTASAFEILYDGRGNVVEKDGQRYAYDAENRLLAVHDAAGALIQENVYDAFGNRVIQRQGSLQTVYIDGLYEESATSTARHVMAEGSILATVVAPRAGVQLIAQVPDSGGPGGGALSLAGLVGLLFVAGWRRPRLADDARELGAVANAVRRRPGRSGIGLALMPLYLMAAWQPMLLGCVPEAFGDAYYYHTDHLGSVQVVSDERGQVVERRSYRPYGDRHAWSGPEVGNEELLASFGGARFDRETDLYHMGARHYDATLGRFLSADVIVSDPTDPRTLHRYAFAGGNPIRLSDPTGRWFWDDVANAVTSVFNDAVEWFDDAASAVNDFFDEYKNEILVVAILLAVVVGVAIFPGSILMWGIAFGAVETTIVHFANGGSLDDLLGPLVLAIAISAAVGAAGGAVTGKLTALSKKYLFKGIFSRTAAFLSKGAAGLAKAFKAGGAALTVARVSYAAGTGQFLLPTQEAIGYLDNEVASPGLDHAGRWLKNTLGDVLPEPDPSWFGMTTYPGVP